MSYGFRSLRTRPDKDHRHGGGGHKNRTDCSGIVNAAKLPCNVAWRGRREGMVGEASIYGKPMSQSEYMSYRNLLLEMDNKGRFIPQRWIFPIEKTNSKWHVKDPFLLINETDERTDVDISKKEQKQLEIIAGELHQQLPLITTKSSSRFADTKRLLTNNSMTLLRESFSGDFVTKIRKIYYLSRVSRLAVPIYFNQNP